MARRICKWDDSRIKEVLDRFYEENQRYPTAHDFQFTEYLPDPDTVRRLYGGVGYLRRKFGLEIEDYTRGPVRSELNRKLNDRAKLHEEEIQKILIEQFGEICVHKEREFAYRSRVDFQIYHTNGIFGVDTFYPKNRMGMINIYNIKFPKYKKFTAGPIYLVCMNPELDQIILDEYLKGRKNATEDKIKLVSKEHFLSELIKYKRREQV